MLLVKTRLEKSSAHGIGLFANENIKKGTIVWRFEPGFDRSFTEKEIESIPEQAKNFVMYYAFQSSETKRFILSSDNDKFTNHSTNPNVGTSTKIHNDELIYVALKDISKGDEITTNYNKSFIYEMKQGFS